MAVHHSQTLHAMHAALAGRARACRRLCAAQWDNALHGEHGLHWLACRREGKQLLYVGILVGLHVWERTSAGISFVLMPCVCTDAMLGA